MSSTAKKSAGLTPLVRLKNIRSNVAVLRTDFAIAKSGFNKDFFIIPVEIDQLIRSHRRTIGLQITSDARLIVRAPYSTSEDFIDRLIRKKESWIRSKQDYFQQRQSAVPVKLFVPGEDFLFLGQRYTLTAVADLPKAVVFSENRLMMAPMVLSHARDHLESWYRRQALAYFTQRVRHYASLEGLAYTCIRIREAKTRWGSCGYKDSLNFTWRLIMAPACVVDYVIIHELMHLKQKNHSHKFWAEVARVQPDYRQNERWLKTYGHLLVL